MDLYRALVYVVALCMVSYAHGAKCSTETPSDECKELIAALQQQVADNWKQYPYELVDATSQQVQLYLSREANEKACAMPCNVELKCHDAVVGDKCFDHVKFAKDHGITDHPTWYPKEFTADPSTVLMVDLQAYLYHIDKGHECSKPCSTFTYVPVPSKWAPSSTCKTAEEGSTCFEAASSAKATINANKESWPSYLSADSKLTEFQLVFYQRGEAQCDLPCGVQLCKDAMVGDECRTEIEAVLANLDSPSRELIGAECFRTPGAAPSHADVQAYLNTKTTAWSYKCRPPCGKTSLFPCGNDPTACRDVSNEKGAQCYENVVHLKQSVLEDVSGASETGVPWHFEELPVELIGVKPTVKSISAIPFTVWQAYLHQLDNGHDCPAPCEDSAQLLCHDVSSTSHPACYNHIRWAKKSGVTDHAGWYPSVLVNGWTDPETEKHYSPTEEWFQMYLYEMDGGHDCPKPCKPLPLRIPQMSHYSNANDHECQTASDTVAVECYEHVVWAKTEGIRAHPEWYPLYLKADSSDGDWQHFLYSQDRHLLGGNPCPLPCGVEMCHDEVEDDECHKHVIWAMQTGIATHPEWYPECLVAATKGQTAAPTFADFQAFMYQPGWVVGMHECRKPCAKTHIFPCDTAGGGDCLDTVKGDSCYEMIKADQKKAVAGSASDYLAGLNADSTVADWQLVYSQQKGQKGIKCLKPCSDTGAEWEKAVATHPDSGDFDSKGDAPTADKNGGGGGDAPTADKKSGDGGGGGGGAAAAIIIVLLVVGGAAGFVFYKKRQATVTTYSIAGQVDDDDADDVAMLGGL